MSSIDYVENNKLKLLLCMIRFEPNAKCSFAKKKNWHQRSSEKDLFKSLLFQFIFICVSTYTFIH